MTPSHSLIVPRRTNFWSSEWSINVVQWLRFRYHKDKITEKESTGKQPKFRRMQDHTRSNVRMSRTAQNAFSGQPISAEFNDTDRRFRVLRIIHQSELYKAQECTAWASFKWLGLGIMQKPKKTKMVRWPIWLLNAFKNYHPDRGPVIEAFHFYWNISCDYNHIVQLGNVCNAKPHIINYDTPRVLSSTSSSSVQC